MREEVDCVGEFEAFIRDASLSSAQAGVVDEDIARPPTLPPALSKPLHIASDEQSISHSSTILFLHPRLLDDILPSFFRILLVRRRESTGHDNVGTGRGEEDRRLLTDAELEPEMITVRPVQS